MDVEFYYYYFERSKGKGEKTCIFDICFLLLIFDIIALVCSELKLGIRSYFILPKLFKLIIFAFLITDYFILSDHDIY